MRRRAHWGRGTGPAIGDARRRPRVAFLVNGGADSAMGHRARALAGRLRDRFRIAVHYRGTRKGLSAAAFALRAAEFRPAVCYVFDMAYSGVLAAAVVKTLFRSRLAVDTGDAITALAHAVGRGPVGRLLTACLERFALGVADAVVVRGTFHKEWLQARGVSAEVIPDGVETDWFVPADATDLRRELGLGSDLVVGLLGSVVWNPRRQTCYGWDLVELLRLLKGRPVSGVLIGGGSGLEVLRQRCRDYGVEDRIRFLGPIPYELLPRYLNLFDVALSTQTDDLPGRVRTTGKLPLYAACGRYILASRVGEAARVLPEEMLVEYRGAVDPDYPSRLAERVESLLGDRARLLTGLDNVAVARTHFDYDVLAVRLASVLARLC